MSFPRWLWPQSKIVRVIDGDSIEASLTRDMGFHGTVTFRQRLRLNRINCPAAGTSLGDQATRFTTTFSLYESVLIETVKPYKYGDEWMAEVTSPAGENLSDLLVRHGLAAYWDGTGPAPLG